MFDWDDLRVFLAAYREGSIGRAAEALGMSASTVSRRLTGLEDALGQALFLRTPDGLVPTEAGRRAHGVAEDAERSTTRLESVLLATDLPRGNVRVSISTEILHSVLLPTWSEFVARYPEITVELVESTAVADLERWEADIGVRTVRPTSGDNLVITKVRDSQVGLFGSARLLARHGLAAEDDEALRRASDERWQEFPWLDWTTDRAHLGTAKLRAHFFPRARVVLRCSSMETQRLAAAAGVGLVLLPRFFGCITPTLVELPAGELPGPQPVYLVGHQATRSTGRVAAVWAFLEQLLRGDDAHDIGRARGWISDVYGIRYPEN